MSIVRCNNGHYYDDALYNICPHCVPDSSLSDQVNDAGEEDDVRNLLTIMEDITSSRDLEKQLTEHYMEGNEEDARTIGLFFNDKDIQPVCGWLVCEAGPERGNSYKINAGRNFVGRSYKSDIVIYDDTSVSRENHCSVIFEPKTNKFYIMPSENAITMINGKVLKDADEITEDDQIKVGETVLRMIPYCKEGRGWDD